MVYALINSAVWISIGLFFIALNQAELSKHPRGEGLVRFGSRAGSHNLNVVGGICVFLGVASFLVPFIRPDDTSLSTAAAGMKVLLLDLVMLLAVAALALAILLVGKAGKDGEREGS